MINVSNLFKEELNNGNRNYLAYADITLKDNTVLKLDPSDIWSNGLGNEENVSSPNSFDIGSAIINKCTLVINNIYDKYSKYDFEEAKVHISVGLKLSNGTIEKVNLGYFNVNEPRHNGALITLECLDDMAKFDKKYSESKLVYPATLLQIVQDACGNCGVLCGIADFENSGYVISERPSDEALTFRQVLAWVGQIACIWFKIDKLGKLNCGWYKTQTTENTHVINSISTMNICTDDVVITGVQVTEHNMNPEEKGNSYKEGEDGYVLSIQNNKLINKGSAQEIAKMIGRKVIGLRFRPMNISFQNNPTIEAGDNVNIVDYKGKTFKTFVTGNRFTVGSLQSIECGAKSPQRNSADRFSQSAQDYIEAQKEIIKEKTEREKAIENLQQTLGDSSGMFITEEKQPDGSTITYIHDKPTKEESKNVIKVTSEAIGISNDGGKTYPYGLFLTGDVITRLLYAVGINADYIRTGIISDKYGANYWNLDNGDFTLSASTTVGGQTVDEIAQDEAGKAQQNAIDTANKALIDYANIIKADMINLQKQVDGQVEDWYYDYEPTPYNVPASNWSTEEDKKKHEGDRFFWKSKGYAYRWMKDGYTWKWVLLQDTDITKALQEAANAKDIADGKRRSFITEPTAPYDVGDLWFDGVDILTCTNPRVQGGYFYRGDWKKLNQYTDDTVANEALENSKNPNQFLTHQQVFNKLTNNGAIKGIFMRDGQLYINGSYIQAETLSAIVAKLGTVQSADISNYIGSTKVFQIVGNAIRFYSADGIASGTEMSSYSEMYDDYHAYMHINGPGILLTDYSLRDMLASAKAGILIDSDLQEVIITGMDFKFNGDSVRQCISDVSYNRVGFPNYGNILGEYTNQSFIAPQNCWAKVQMMSGWSNATLNVNGSGVLVQQIQNTNNYPIKTTTLIPLRSGDRVTMSNASATNEITVTLYGMR